MSNLKLTAEMIKNHLFNGGFRAFDKYDSMAYADAELGSLITNMEIGKYYYEVIFTPSQGDVQIFYIDPDGNSEFWEMDLNTGKVGWYMAGISNCNSAFKYKYIEL